MMRQKLKQKRPFHVMIIPTLGCPSKCAYCWSSEVGSPIMSIETIKDTVAWLKDFRSDPVTFTFHGGEPLLAGADFYRQALPLLTGELQHLEPNFALQTNLWKLTPELADVLAEYNIPIGSSLDGPQELNDLQRSEGYYERTMKGYELAKEHGLQVQFICTFTSHSVQFKEDIFNFFLENDLTLKLHPALPSLRSDEPDKWALSPEKYGELLVYLLDKYLENMIQIEVRNINDYADVSSPDGAQSAPLWTAWRIPLPWARTAASIPAIASWACRSTSWATSGIIPAKRSWQSLLQECA